MKITLKSLSVLIVISLLASQLFISSAVTSNGVIKKTSINRSPLSNTHDGYIVKLKDSKTIKGLSKKVKNEKQSLAKVSSAEASKLEKEGKILYKEPNYIRTASVNPNDPYFRYQYSLHNMGCQAGWNIERGYSSSVTVAVIDTGVDLHHPDLSSKIVPGYDFINGDSGAYDDNGHGTHVAGIVSAATNNSRGVAGVSWNAKIMPVKVLSAYGYGSDLGVANGIYWAVDHGAKIINLSLGGSGYSQTLANATTYAYNNGVLVFAAAGNDYSSIISYPAGNPNVIGVAATDSRNRRAAFSNYNSSVDVAAPGVSVLSTYIYGRQHVYSYMSGTSMATPNAAGVAAVVLSKYSSYSVDELSDAVINGSRDLGSPGRDNYYGHGLVNLNYALRDNISLSYITGSRLIRYNDTAKIRGSIKQVNGAQELTLVRRKLGNTTWSSPQTIMTDANGVFSFDNKQTYGQTYSFSWAGALGIHGTTVSRRVDVKPKVTTSFSRKTLKYGRTMTIYGYVFPRHNAHKVRVYIYKGGKRYLKYAKLRGSWSDRSKYTFRWRPRRGSYRIRVVYPGDRDHASSAGRLNNVRVY